jgi:hypothetical protein
VSTPLPPLAAFPDIRAQPPDDYAFAMSVTAYLIRPSL